MMQPGSTSRFQCNDCNVEFEVTLEPKADATTKGVEPQAVHHCPFCGSEQVENLTDD